MFKIIKEKQNDISRVKLINKNTGEYLSIVPEFGANVNEIVLNKFDKLYSIHDGNNYLNEFKTIRIFNGAKLFPFPNRINSGKYNFSGITYQLPINYKAEGNSAHGFIYDRKFDIYDTEITSNSARVSFVYNYDGSIKGFPFPFEIDIDYIIHKTEGIICTTTVKNKSENPFPFGDGWHPFFRFNGIKVNDLLLKFNSNEIVVTDKNLIPNGTEEYQGFQKFSKIGEKEFDSCFILNSNISKHTVELFEPKESNKISLWFEGGNGKYNYVQLYTPPDRKSIAIEPMTCNVDAYNNKEGLQILEPSEKYSAKYGVKLS